VLSGNELAELQFEITHLCNKMCPLCDHRIKHSHYTFLTAGQYKRIVSCVERPISSIMVVGGEPLCHPYFEQIVGQMIKDFPLAKIRVLTNGKLLPGISTELFRQLHFVLQTYHGFNDAAVEWHRRCRNVTVKDALAFGDPYVDPKLDKDIARQIRRSCNYQVRIVGTRLYGCCLAEGIERYYNTEPVHVEFDKNWQENWLNLPTWKACQHCYVAGATYARHGYR